MAGGGCVGLYSCILDVIAGILGKMKMEEIEDATVLLLQMKQPVFLAHESNDVTDATHCIWKRVRKRILFTISQ